MGKPMPFCSLRLAGTKGALRNLCLSLQTKSPGNRCIGERNIIVILWCHYDCLTVCGGGGWVGRVVGCQQACQAPGTGWGVHTATSKKSGIVMCVALANIGQRTKKDGIEEIDKIYGKIHQSNTTDCLPGRLCGDFIIGTSKCRDAGFEKPPRSPHSYMCGESGAPRPRKVFNRRDIRPETPPRTRRLCAPFCPSLDRLPVKNPLTMTCHRRHRHQLQGLCKQPVPPPAPRKGTVSGNKKTPCRLDKLRWLFRCPN